MLIKNVMEIDLDDPTIQELSSLMAQFGISEMVEVLEQLAAMNPQRGGQVMIMVNDLTASEVVATFLSFAAVNYGCWKYEEFGVQYPREDGELGTARFFRELSPEKYKELGDGYLAQAKTLIQKYFPNEEK